MPTSKTRTAAAFCQYLNDIMTDDSLRDMHLYGGGAVAELEKKIGKFYGKKHALCVSNATTALMALALALELKNQAFITSPYSYGATVAGWLMRGNIPTFADIDPVTLTLECASVRKAITPKTRAILVSDIYGNPHDSEEMRRIADECGLLYIADCAQSLGATRSGIPSGVCADALVISFTVGKTVFAGEGAAIVTDNEILYEKLLWLTQHPKRQKKELGLYLSNEFGLNARIHPLAAIWANATWSSQMSTLADHQRACYETIEALNSLGLTEHIPFTPSGMNPSFFRLTASWKNTSGGANLAALNASLGPILLEDAPVQLIYRQPAFIAQYKKFADHANCPQAEAQVSKRFCLIRGSEHSGSAKKPRRGSPARV